MRILYGVVGEGMGHATRSRVVLEHLLRKGHEIKVVVSGRAYKFLQDRFTGRANITFEEITGLHLIYEENAVDRSASLWSNLAGAPRGIQQNVEAWRKVVGDFDVQAVFSDFESWAWMYARAFKLPLVSIDNMQVINRCRHDHDVTDNKSFDFQLAKLAVKARVPGAYHYLIASFFFPPVRKLRTTLIPPILRPEILAAKREPQSHILVYQTAASNTRLLPILKQLPYEFRVYGLGREERDGNVHIRAFSEHGFVEDLRTARAAIAGGGFSLMSEAVHLHVPLLSVPMEKQYEQVINAAYLQKLGYGRWAEELDAATITDFLTHVDAHAAALEGYTPHDNSMLFACIDELIEDIAQGGTPKPFLLTPAMGTWEAPEEEDED